jgi:heme-degrading monooxygenase HmoA
MVLSVMKWNIHPDKAEAYAEWAQSAIPRVLATEGLVEFRGYRPASGSHQVVTTTEYATMADWAAAASSETWNEIIAELHTMATDITTEIWGPSPVLPKPIRPGG